MMKILVLNGSPAGENSITLCTVRFLEKLFPECSFDVLHAGQRIRSMEKDFASCKAALEAADLILFCYPVYTFLAPAQLHRFIELMKENGAEVSGKYAAQITTSKHFYDVTAHQFIRDNCSDMGLRYIGGLSADMEDLLTEKGQKEAEEFFRYVLWSIRHGYCEPSAGVASSAGPVPSPCREPSVSGPERPAAKKAGRVVIVSDLPAGTSDSLRNMIRLFQSQLPYETRVVNLQKFPFSGGCLGCFRCAAEGKCVQKDGFDIFLRETIQSADAIVYAYTIRDHSMGYRFKLFDDRQFCNGHRTVTMGKPVGYLISGQLDGEPNLKMLMEARAQVGGNYLAGIAADQRDAEAETKQLADQLTYALEHRYSQPKNFYGVGGLKIFRDLIWQMQGLMREDHRFYKENGFYDFPQKQKGRIIGMYAVGMLMNQKKLKKMIGGKMTEGMILPYRKVIEKAGSRQPQG